MEVVGVAPGAVGTGGACTDVVRADVYGAAAADVVANVGVEVGSGGK